jgi:hypothetical protein
MSWGFVAVAGATLINGKLSSDAAGDAADAQAAGTTAATAEQRRQFDITQASLQPRQLGGDAAFEQQRILLGLGGTDPNAKQRSDLEAQLATIDQQQPSQPSQQQFIEQQATRNLTPAQRLSMGFNVTTAGLQHGSTAQQEERKRQLQEQEQFTQQQTIGSFDDQRASIKSQLDALPAFNSGTNAEQQQSAFDQFNQSPGQTFLRDRAQKNLLRNSAAIGGLGGGNVRSALVEQGVGFAQQDFNNQFGRLGQLAGQGQAATTAIGQFGQQTANNIGSNLIASGNARATGLTNQSNAVQNTISGLGTAAGQFFSRPPNQLASNGSRTQLLGN